MASIKKIKERKYKITVSNGYRLDGRKISKARTITVPDSVSKRGIGQFVAHAAEEFERTVKNGFGEDAETPFQKYAEAWLKRQVKYAPSTLASYERMLKCTYPYIGQIPLCKLRPIALENMLNELRQREFRGEKIREETAQKYLTVVSAVLSDAKRNEIIQKNPARMIDLPITERAAQCIPTPEEAHEFLDAICNEPYVYRAYYFLAIYTGCRRGELAALRWSDFFVKSNGAILTVQRSRSIVAGRGVMEGPTKNGRSRQIYIEPAALEKESLKYETFFKILIATGMRCGECCGLKWGDIDYKERSIHIQRNVVKLSGEEIIVKEPKTSAGDRYVYFSYEMETLLNEYRRECKYETSSYDERELTDDDYIFRRKGAALPMTPSSFTWRFKLILRKHGLPESLNVHSLRHTNASLLIAGGTDVTTVAGLLGHAQPSTTLDIYSHAFDKNKREASRTMQAGIEI